jgi:hypothetical protein
VNWSIKTDEREREAEENDGEHCSAPCDMDHSVWDGSAQDRKEKGDHWKAEQDAIGND